MTSQTKKFIESKDLIGMRFQCKQCGASLSLPLSQKLDATKLQSCPNCSNPWLSVGGSSIQSLVTTFVEDVKKLQAQFSGEREAFPAGCSFLIEVVKEEREERD